ncbi:MAG: tyrosine-type recombinase/integrase [Planctomycetes bacterium]|nr:tyrosine-type recombinase/integrase [Planctomycetota bacterium]
MRGRSPEGNNLGAAELARFGEYLRLCGCSERTLEGYAEMLRPFFRYAAERGARSLGEVTRDDVVAYPTALFYAVGGRGKPLAPATQSKRLTALKSFYRFLAKYQLVLVDPTADLELPKDVRALPRVLSRRERDQLFALCDRATVLGYRDRTILEVLYATGLRSSELVELAIPDVRLDEGLVTVRQGKGKKDRTVPLGKVAAAYLREYLAHIRPRLVVGWNGGAHRRQSAQFRPRDQAGHVFLTKSGRPFCREVLEGQFQFWVERAGLAGHVVPHSLRHTCATDMLRGGADMRHLAELLGHARMRTTQRYTHVVKKDLKRVHGKCHPRERLPLDDVRFRPRAGEAPDAEGEAQP